MSSKPITLEDYLANRRAGTRKQSQRSLHFNEQPLHGVSVAHSQIPVSINDPVYYQQREPWQTNFPDCKRECLQELRRLKERIANQQYYIVRYLENYESQVHASLQEQFQRIKQDLINLLDRCFEENRKRVKDNFHNQGGHELAQLDQIRQKLNQIKRQIEEYQRALEGAAYKNGIAALVLADFEGQGQSLMTKIATALMRYQDKVFLRVDSIKFNRIRDDISTLISYGDFDRGKIEMAMTNYGAAALSTMKNYPSHQIHQIRYQTPPKSTTAMFGRSQTPPKSTTAMFGRQFDVPYASNLGDTSSPAMGQTGMMHHQSMPSPMSNGLHRNRDLLQAQHPAPQ